MNRQAFADLNGMGLTLRPGKCLNAVVALIPTELNPSSEKFVHGGVEHHQTTHQGETAEDLICQNIIIS
jgi:hypothetical protein